MYKIKLSDRASASFISSADETLLQAALGSGLGFPYECTIGACGSCMFQLRSGKVAEPRKPSDTYLAARKSGYYLACQCFPKSDCEIDVQLNEKFIPTISPESRTVRLAKREALTHDMYEITFTSDAPAEFLPGQFVLLNIPGVEGPRAYSMCNLPGEREWKFIVKRVQGGVGTTVLLDRLAIGDTVTLHGPYGFSFLRNNSARDIVCIAGGSGLSPILSILRGAVRDPSLKDCRVHFFYGGKSPRDMCVRSLFDTEKILAKRIRLVEAVSDKAEPKSVSWTGEQGFVHEVVAKFIENSATEFEYYFCGPPPMVDAVNRMLSISFRVPGPQLHFDRFY
ncbi:2Fe-2S iron-sulfur cluster-binding protein [Hyphococcus sp.]|uniref:2Fe-2S iron-sulfur cluster-binding protein n=1 Tax=Hyphococcus sp. TaxID=2038636 RepID=UPI0035C6D8D4